MDFTWLYDAITGFPKLLQVVILSMVPIIESRGAIPYGVGILNLPPLEVALAAFAGSMIPVPFLLVFLRPIFKWLRNLSFFRKLIDRYTHRTMKKINKTKKFSTGALILFVGVPLPSTGVWTGSFAASLVNLRYRHGFVAILIGNFIACSLITILTVFFTSAI